MSASDFRVVVAVLLWMMLLQTCSISSDLDTIADAVGPPAKPTKIFELDFNFERGQRLPFTEPAE